MLKLRALSIALTIALSVSLYIACKNMFNNCGWWSLTPVRRRVVRCGKVPVSNKVSIQIT